MCRHFSVESYRERNMTPPHQQAFSPPAMMLTARGTASAFISSTAHGPAVQAFTPQLSLRKRTAPKNLGLEVFASDDHAIQCCGQVGGCMHLITVAFDLCVAFTDELCQGRRHARRCVPALHPPHDGCLGIRTLPLPEGPTAHAHLREAAPALH